MIHRNVYKALLSLLSRTEVLYYYLAIQFLKCVQV